MKDLNNYITERLVDTTFVIKPNTIGKTLRRLSLIDLDDRPNSLSNLITRGVDGQKINNLIKLVPSMKEEIMDLVNKSTFSHGGIRGSYYDKLFQLAVAGCKTLNDIPYVLNTFCDVELDNRVIEFEDNTYAIRTKNRKLFFLIIVK